MKGSPLLIPDVSRGNVGQLTADLLISTLKVFVQETNTQCFVTGLDLKPTSFQYCGRFQLKGYSVVSDSWILILTPCTCCDCQLLVPKLSLYIESLLVSL